MKSIPNLEIPPAVDHRPPPKGDGSVDKPELSGEALTGLCGLARTSLSLLQNLTKSEQILRYH